MPSRRPSFPFLVVGSAWIPATFRVSSVLGNMREVSVSLPCPAPIMVSLPYSMVFHAVPAWLTVGSTDSPLILYFGNWGLERWRDEPRVPQSWGAMSSPLGNLIPSMASDFGRHPRVTFSSGLTESTKSTGGERRKDELRDVIVRL